MHTRWLALLCYLMLMIAIGRTESAPSNIKLLAYNIHHAEGRDGRLDLERIADILRKSGADILALQELDVHTRRTRDVDQPAELARLLGFHHHFAKSIYHQGGQYGLCVLSRWPIVESKVHPLPYHPGQEPRVAQEIVIQPEGDLPPIGLFNTHLCHLSEATRMEQVTRILELLPKTEGRDWILTGDFNARPDSAPMQTLWQAGCKDLLESHNGIDYILVSGDQTWKRVQCLKLDEPIASDHLPVLAELAWRTSP